MYQFKIVKLPIETNGNIEDCYIRTVHFLAKEWTIELDERLRKYFKAKKYICMLKKLFYCDTNCASCKIDIKHGILIDLKSCTYNQYLSTDYKNFILRLFNGNLFMNYRSRLYNSLIVAIPTLDFIDRIDSDFTFVEYQITMPKFALTIERLNYYCYAFNFESGNRIIYSQTIDLHGRINGDFVENFERKFSSLKIINLEDGKEIKLKKNKILFESGHKYFTDFKFIFEGKYIYKFTNCSNFDFFELIIKCMMDNYENAIVLATKRAISLSGED